MGKNNGFWHYFWIMFTIFMILTWALWFFDIDIKDISVTKPVVSNSLQKAEKSLYESKEILNKPIKEPEKPSGETLCKQDFNKYASITESKYGTFVKFNLIKLEVVNNSQEYEEFFTLYKNPYSQKEGVSSYPAIVLATRADYDSGVEKYSLPYVLMCGSDGELTEGSRQLMLG